MIKKIICPTDFSPASENAINYAAKLCQALGTSMELITVESVYPASMMLAPAHVNEKAMITAEMMEYICDHIKQTYTISCDFEIFISNHSIDRTLKQNKSGNFLVVMGTSNPQSIIKKYWGSTTYRFMKQTNYSLLIIPEHVPYRGIHKLILANEDTSITHSSALDLIKEKFKPSVTVLQVYSKPNSHVEKSLSDGNIHKQIISDNAHKSIHNYALSVQADMLVVIDKQKGFFKNLFHLSVIKKLSRQDSYPVLVIKANKHEQ